MATLSQPAWDIQFDLLTKLLFVFGVVLGFWKVESWCFDTWQVYYTPMPPHFIKNLRRCNITYGFWYHVFPMEQWVHAFFAIFHLLHAGLLYQSIEHGACRQTVKLQWEDWKHSLTLTDSSSHNVFSTETSTMLHSILFCHSSSWLHSPWSISEELQSQQDLEFHAEDLKTAELHKLKQDLNLYNATGHIVTFDRIVRDWVAWNKYVFKFFNIFILLTSLNRPCHPLKTKNGVSILVPPAVFGRSANLFCCSTLMLVTLGMLQRIVRCRPLRDSQRERALSILHSGTSMPIPRLVILVVSFQSPIIVFGSYNSKTLQFRGEICVGHRWVCIVPCFL